MFVDETFDFLKLLEIRGLQEREQVTHVKLFPGHGDGGGGGGGNGVLGSGRCGGEGLSNVTLSACCQGPWAAHRRSLQAPLCTRGT